MTDDEVNVSGEAESPADKPLGKANKEMLAAIMLAKLQPPSAVAKSGE